MNLETCPNCGLRKKAHANYPGYHVGPRCSNRERCDERKRKKEQKMTYPKPPADQNPPGQYGGEGM